MTEKHHHYAVTVTWTGNQGTGTASYRGYSRDHLIQGDGKPAIEGSSDPAFRGDPARWNPEELLLASLPPATSFGTWGCAPRPGLWSRPMKTAPKARWSKKPTVPGNLPP